MRSRALVFAAAVLLVVPALWAHPVKPRHRRSRPAPRVEGPLDRIAVEQAVEGW